jgi:hypothetical protein
VLFRAARPGDDKERMGLAIAIFCSILLAAVLFIIRRF